MNNYGPEDEARLTGMGEATPEETVIEYLIFGREVGASGTRHLQGFVSFKSRRRFAYVRSVLGEQCHVEKAKGTPGDNRTYCSKEGDFEEFGEAPPDAPNSSKLTDELAAAVIEHIRNKRNVEAADCVGAASWLRNSRRYMENAFVGLPPVERSDVRVFWYYGPPGWGKSRRAHLEAVDPYMKDSRTKWWHSYQLETDVIIDDMDRDGIHINHLLKWFDRYKCNVETKGGQMPLFARNFWITSNYPPEEVFPDARPDTINALRRRMTVTHFLHSWQPSQDADAIEEEEDAVEAVVSEED